MEFSIKAKLQELAAELTQREALSDPNLTGNNHLASDADTDAPVNLLELNRQQCLALVGAIAYSILDGVTVEDSCQNSNLWLLPPEAIEVCDRMTQDELLATMHRLTERLPKLPVNVDWLEENDPCPICGALETDWENGFCPDCNAKLNGAAAAQVMGELTDDA